ncbi:hypothetical protein KUL25_19190 [Rhodobacteraceae bacterium N5(2021)]|uniref:Uncharacterized protein n=1 Tax=Gymnodinialimonas phycosphaerae TaxID=2841589 RepID=A0A975TVG8_9RHOB|nr:hypothetical protein [Gymnodinialimonas phycosphaerae]MBY4894889.1 hypothetical protein [Gymnodinialimonas phycosphaerae]
MALPRLNFLSAKRVAMAACVSAAASPAAAQAPSVGSVIADPVVLGRMFANVCVAATDAPRVEASLDAVGMVPSPETGTYFHQLFDLSVSPTGGGCSMVFVTDLDDDAAMAAFEASMVQAVGAHVPTFAMNVRETGGESYVRARIEVSW